MRARPHVFTEIAGYFLKLGVLGFGGPLAVMAAFQKDLVERRKWISHERFAQALALIKALPGPTGTMLAVYLGQVRGGRLGGLLAGTLFILPAFLMMVALGIFYENLVHLSWSKAVLLGMQAAALGVIIESSWKLAKPFSTSVQFWIVCILGFVATFFKPNFEPLIILGAGGVGVLLHFWLEQSQSKARKHAQKGFVVIQLSALLALGWVCFKAGAFVFGTGLAIVPMLAHDVVVRGWLTSDQFMQALAFGQITPGPVVITATFVGYKVAGLLGAIVATCAIFFPAFFNILTWFPWVERKLGATPWVKAFIRYAIAAVVGAIIAAIFALAKKLGTDPRTLALIAGAFAASISGAPIPLVIPVCGILGAIIF